MIKNKAQIWTLEALRDIVNNISFKILGIDSDNGSEFINARLLKFCEENEGSVQLETKILTVEEKKEIESEYNSNNSAELRKNHQNHSDYLGFRFLSGKVESKTG